MSLHPDLHRALWLKSWLIATSALNCDPFTLHVYLAFLSWRAAAAAEQADLSFWKQKDPAPKASSLLEAQGTKITSRCAYGTGRLKSAVLPGRCSSPCADSWTQPTAGVRDNKQQEPSTGDSSALQTAMLGLGRCQTEQPHLAQNLPDSVQSLLRAGSPPRCAHGPGTPGTALPQHPFASQTQPHQLWLVPTNPVIPWAFKSNSQIRRVPAQPLCLAPGISISLGYPQRQRDTLAH